MLRSIYKKTHFYSQPIPARFYNSKKLVLSKKIASVDDVPHASDYVESHPAFVDQSQLGKRKALAYFTSFFITGIMVYAVGYDRIMAIYSENDTKITDTRKRNI